MATTETIPSVQETGSWKARDDPWEEAVLTWHEQVAAAFRKRLVHGRLSATPWRRTPEKTRGALRHQSGFHRFGR